MFDDLDTAERKTEGDPRSVHSEVKSSSRLYRWAHFPAMLAFGLLFILFRNHPWRWQIAIDGAYTVYVFFFALGAGLQSLDDLFGDSRVSRSVAKLLIPHILILALVTVGVTSWFHLRPTLPEWATHEGRKGSLWDYCGWIILAVAGIWQGIWMGGKIKLEFGAAEDEA